MIVINEFTFFDNAAAEGYSPELTNNYGESLVLTVTGNFVGTIEIYGKKNDTAFKLALVDLQTITIIDDITAPGAYTVVSPYGFSEIGAVISSYTSGSVTVTGRLCKS